MPVGGRQTLEFYFQLSILLMHDLAKASSSFFLISVADFFFIFKVQVVVMNICFLQVWLYKPVLR